MINPILEQKMDKITEQIFGTEKDPDQIPINRESGEKLEKLTPHWIKYALDDKGEPIAWSIVVPTSLEMMNKFLRGGITEKELLDLTKPQDMYEALYLCAIVTVPEHQRKGYALKLTIESINSIPHVENVKLFVWPYSTEGAKFIEKLSKSLKINILLKQ